MKSLTTFAPKHAKEIKYLLCDIDDTITTHGKLTAEAYQALWDLHHEGIMVIPVTGRPAGWCDLIVRQWPVMAVVGENGAFAYYFEEGQRKTYTHPAVVEGAEKKLAAIQKRVLTEIPQTRVSKDQFCRKYDLAIDFGEDPPHLGFEVAKQIEQLCLSMGAQAKVSSIHVNTWFGDYDKVSMTLLFLKNILGEEAPKEHCFFFGDSPNDEPMFAYFPHACGVANIRPFAHQLTHKPTYLAEEESGRGFYQSVALLLEQRRG